MKNQDSNENAADTRRSSSTDLLGKLCVRFPAELAGILAFILAGVVFGAIALTPMLDAKAAILYAIGPAIGTWIGNRIGYAIIRIFA